MEDGETEDDDEVIVEDVVRIRYRMSRRSNFITVLSRAILPKFQINNPVPHRED
jgi:hypothetical protein